MKVARIAVLGVAIAAGGAAALLMGGGSPPGPQPAESAAPAVATAEILVAAADLGLGEAVGETDIRWQPWPTEMVPQGAIRKTDAAGGLDEFVGSTVRMALLAGEPVRREKIIKGQGGFMSAILPSGMRALAIAIDNRGTTSAGGFILPNDRVDVIQTAQAVADGGAATSMSQIILSNIRVLAIGQNIQERNGEKVITGETATLELTPAQAELVVLAQKVGQLSLALRSMADAHETGTPQRAERHEALQIIRFGVKQQAPAR
ncbi:MAG TPA: Flp pilus assembly protein CpaB [Microvirga sp.]|jgi:pilus assembly protein CpaB|nr:Flp pilus assembly protein CpaB [Microvirga sp.]